MIVFDLQCAQGHGFEGWFDSGDAFERQLAADLVRCPACDTASVTRVPSARVSVPRGEAAAPSAPEAVAGLPPELLAKLREAVRSTENVGRRFPEEARKIHYEEVPHRPIRGTATTEEARALADEGVDFAPIPPILGSDHH
ncbi:MAG TPA: DUF1178 family protein [Casimicrobiaceae bacterium]|jgi:hypothetical protein|nr:DUF1178 family protein [Casimicrobiaceae bacterium]